jgi:hypothetical protein
MSYKAAMSKENAAKNAVQNILPRKSQDIKIKHIGFKVIKYKSYKCTPHV